MKMQYITEIVKHMSVIIDALIAMQICLETLAWYKRGEILHFT